MNAFGKKTTAVLLFLVLAHAGAAVPLKPYRQIRDPWFRVVYPQGYLQEAEMILAYANDVREKHIAWLGEFADETVTIYLSDESNNFATSYASYLGQLYIYLNINAIWAVVPDEAGNSIYNVLAHELTHIAHLSKTGTFGRLMRIVFGQRYPIGGTIPMWFTEGITTNTETLREEFFDESRATSPRSRAIVYTMALEDRLPDFDDITGYLNYQWPNVLTAYILGGNFFNYLVKRFGLPPVRDLVYDYAEKIVPTFKRSFRDAMGEPLDQVWDDWRETRKREALEMQRSLLSGDMPRGRRLTTSGSYKNGIRWVDGLVYTTLRDTTRYRIGLYSVDPATGIPQLISEELGTSYIVGGDERHLYLLSDRNSRTIHYRYYDAYRYNVESGKLTQLTYDLKVSAFDVIDDERVLCSSLYIGRPSLFIASGREAIPIELEEDVMSVNHISVNPDKRNAVLSLTFKDGGTDLALLDIDSMKLRRVTFDRNAKLYPHWIDRRRVSYATPTATGLFNQVVHDLTGGAGQARSDILQITDALGGVYWAHHTGTDLYYMSIHGGGYDIFHQSLGVGSVSTEAADDGIASDESGEAGTGASEKAFTPRPSQVMSPAADIPVSSGHPERRFADAVNMLDFARFPYVGVNWGNLQAADIDVGLSIYSAGIVSAELEYLGYYSVLYPYFSNHVDLRTSAFFLPLALGFSNTLEVHPQDPSQIRENYRWYMDVYYPFSLGLYSSFTVGILQQLRFSRTYRDKVWTSGGLGWAYYPSEYAVMNIGGGYRATETTSIWKNKGLKAVFAFTQPLDGLSGFAPFQYWNNFDLHVALPLFDHDYGVKARFFYGLGWDSTGGPVYGIENGAEAFLVDRAAFGNSVPFRGAVGPPGYLPGQSALLASMELRATIFSSSYVSPGLIPVNLNKIGLLAYADFAAPFSAFFPDDWSGYRLSVGFYLTVELGLLYQLLFMDLNFIIHHTLGEPAPSFAFAMDFPKE